MIAAPIIFIRITDTVPIEEDLKFTDETISDVAPKAMLEEQASARRRVKCKLGTDEGNATKEWRTSG